jgi:hypothetical protein
MDVCYSKQYTISIGDIQIFNSMNVCCILPISVCAAFSSRVKHRYLLLVMTRKWKVRFMRKGSEPPYPFGKTHEIVEASSRLEAIEQV